MQKIGVMALQGAFAEHLDVLSHLQVEALPVRIPQEIGGLDGLIIPGGESTTIISLMKEYGLMAPIRELAFDGFPIMGTCAGMVLLAKHVSGMNTDTLGAMDIGVKRNAFGRQVDSFETNLEIPAIGELPFHAVFIRAPHIEQTGDGVEILAKLPNGVGVAARQGKMVALAFHPELTSDLRIHAYFMGIVRGER
jgi:5'-phosphate synthase pdxT subunit